MTQKWTEREKKVLVKEVVLVYNKKHKKYTFV